jgi:hypothetical protein
MGISNLRLFFFSLLSFSAIAAAKVVLIGNNTTLSFDDIEANFCKFSAFLFLPSNFDSVCFDFSWFLLSLNMILILWYL